MNARNELAEGATLYVNGKPFEMVGVPRIVYAADEIEQWESTWAPSECTWTAPDPQSVVLNLHEAGPMLWWLWATSSNIERAMLFDSKQIGSPPKRPPNPERPMWAINPGRTRRNAFGPSRRVK